MRLKIRSVAFESLIRHLQFKKSERFYHIYLQDNFFNGITIICTWGTFDSKRGNCKHIFCDDMSDAKNKLAEIKNTRHKKGYKIYCS